MANAFDPDNLNKLKQFIEVCKSNPSVLSTPHLKFFADYITSLGGKIPGGNVPPFEPKEQPTTPAPDVPISSDDSEIEEEPESDLELDNSGRVAADTIEASQEMGDSAKEVSEDEEMAAVEKRTQAMSEFAEGNYDVACTTLTDAIKLNPHSAHLFAKRAQVYIKLVKPNACIQDCTKALELNPDSALAYKLRGRAYHLLCEWQKAASDLRQACKIDFDEQADEWLKEVTPNAKKIEEHDLKRQRRQKEREEKERLKRVRKAREAHDKAAKDNQRPTNDDAPPNFNLPPNFANLFSNPELMEALKDPEVANAFRDVSQNPANIMKYQSNPKVMAVIQKLIANMGGGGVGGMGFPTAGNPPPPSDGANFFGQDDDNLD